MALVLGAGAYCEWLEAAEILAVLGFSEGQARSLAAQTQSQETLTAVLETQHCLLFEEKEQLRGLDLSLDQCPNRRVVLLYADLPLALTSMLQQPNRNIVEAIETWQQSLSQLQAFYRKHRGQTLLFDLGQVLKFPQQFLQVCTLEWQQEWPDHLPELSQALDVDPVISMLAQQILQEQPALQQQLLYIQAMTWPLGEKGGYTSSSLSASDLLNYVQSYYDLSQRLKKSQIREADQVLHLQQLKKQLSKAAVNQSELKREGELVLEQLLLAQEELEKKIAAYTGLDQNFLGLKEKLNQNTEEHNKQKREQQHLIDQLTQQLVQLTDQNHVLTEELTQLKALYQQSLQEQEVSAKKVEQSSYQLLEQQRLIDQSQQQLAQLTDQNHVLTEELTQLKVIHEQSLMAQSEFAKQAQELSQENQLILEQLLLAQEELEKRILAERAATKKIEELQALGQENALLVKQLHQTQEALEDLHVQQTEVTVEPLPSEQPEGSTGRDLIVASDLRIHAPDHTVPPRSFLERRTHKKAQRLARRKDLERAEQIAQTPWFDASWYLEQYPDIAADPVQSENPALHYIRMGGFEGRNPSPHFDSAFYLQSNPDVVESGLNPLWHFLQYGQAEGRAPQP